MREIELDHVAFGVPQAARAAPFLAGLGGRPHFSGPGPGYRFWQWQFARGGKLEVLEPDGPPGGFLHRFLESHGPGIHHVTFKVGDIGEATERASAFGYEVVGFSDALPGWKEAFLHPKQAQGIVVQLAEEDPSLAPEGAYSPFPESPEPRAEPADVLGVRLSATSAERARRQWGELLGGACRDDADGLAFAWPSSPLRVAVSVGPGPEGPRAVEIAGAVGGALPEGPHPVLGAAFRAVRERS